MSIYRHAELPKVAPRCPPVPHAALTKPNADELASAFRALADSARLRLLSFIAAQPKGEACVCVCHVIEPVGLSRPTVSDHLKVLHDAVSHFGRSHVADHVAGDIERMEKGGPTVQTVIFACVHSAGRSQMSAAFFNAMANPTVVRGVAAGTEPAARVHPEVVTAMREAGLDLSTAKPQLLTAELASRATLLVTMGCGESCPYVPGLEIVDWDLADPRGQPPDRVRTIRDDIQNRVADLVRARGWERRTP